MKRIEKFLYSCLNRRFYAEDRSEFKETFIVLSKNKSKVEVRNKGIITLNLILKEDGILYEIRSKRDNSRKFGKRGKHFWFVVRLENKNQREFKKAYKKHINLNYHYDKNISRDKVLKSQYGLTLEQYKQMIDIQGGNCAICENNQENLLKGLAVDHDHKTNKNRGLLCTRCNMLLGYALDKVEILEKATEYLKYWNTK